MNEFWDYYKRKLEKLNYAIDCIIKGACKVEQELYEDMCNNMEEIKKERKKKKPNDERIIRLDEEYKKKEEIQQELQAIIDLKEHIWQQKKKY